MKKWKVSLAGAAVLLVLGSGSALAAKESAILLNDKQTTLGSSQIIEENSTLVPLKALAEAMGYTFFWNQKSKIAVLIRPGREVLFTTGSTAVQVNGGALKLTKTPHIIKGTVYVPLVSAVSAMGGKTWTDRSSGNIMLVDEPRFTQVSIQNRTYWVSQNSGELFLKAATDSKPKSIGTFPLTGWPYSHSLQIKNAGGGNDLLLLTDKHYAMFNDFTNEYQALIRNGTILKQTDYHYSIVSYPHEAEPATEQLYMRDDTSLQYINTDGSLGKPFDLAKSTGRTGDFTVEYVSKDVALIRYLEHAELFAIHTVTGEITNLNEKLIMPEDRKEWNTADGRDTFVVTKMLALKKREGNVMTFTYATLPEGKVKTVVYTIK
ncbi:copper amine oxidase N-terminal domain-containing protein [Paenibacillus sp. HW567]|uniref:copper amine oxidase N-terminal domain-containing protein n=1 Tax=Paenibacillus sp. HW567 TaxID=1034769 RepID=UPI00035EFE6B|nr:copper amine oxidase N-terminal domain-containing protein [Paenibacillus sp. HW567]